MSAYEKLILNPVEFTPELPERDLSALGIAIGEAGPDYGESSVQVERIKKAIGEGATSSHWPSVEASVPLIVSSNPAIPQAQAFQPIEAFVAEVQRRNRGWIRRDFADAAGFSGSVGCPVDAAAITTPKGLGRVDEITLKLSRYPFWFATVEILAGEAEGSGVRDLQIELAELLGTVPGLIRVVVTNEGTEDWRGCLLSIECDDYSSAATALPKYEAKDLTPNGAAEVATVSGAEVVKCPPLSAGWITVLSSELASVETRRNLILNPSAEGGAELAKVEAPLANAKLTGSGSSTSAFNPDDGARSFFLQAEATAASGLAILNWLGSGEGGRCPVTAGVTYYLSALGCVISSKPAQGQQFYIEWFNSKGELLSISSGAQVTKTGSQVPPELIATAPAGATSATILFGNFETMAKGEVSTFYIDGLMFTDTPGSFFPTVAQLEAGDAAFVGDDYESESVLYARGHMTHVGPRRMAFRVKDVSAALDDVQWKLEWRALGAANWIQTMEGSTPIVAVSPVVGDYQSIDLGECRPEQAITGSQRWEWRLQVCSPSGSGVQPLIRDVYPASTEQWMRVADTNESQIDGEPVKTPGTVEDAIGVGTIAWSTPKNAKAVDGATARAELAEGVISHFLKATNMGFALPTTSTILGIKPAVLFEAGGGGSNVGLSDIHARIVKAGAIKETVDRATNAVYPAIGFEWITYGGLGDLFGQSWTPADINNSGFGFAIAFKGLGPFTISAKVDAITITVAYSEGANENRVCFAERSLEFTDNGIRRQHITDEVWGELVPDGFLPYAPPSGQGGQPIRALIVPSVGDFDSRADSATVKPNAKVFYRPAYLFAREAA